MSTLILVKPSEEYIDELQSFRQEYISCGERVTGSYSSFNGDLHEWVRFCQLSERAETLPRYDSPYFVEHTQYLLMSEGSIKVLGIIMLRHLLNGPLSEIGGHIGFSVRPSERRRGYAKVMLKLCLEKCREMRLEKVLITCDEDNEASRRTILACGGVFERTAAEGETAVERYLITLSSASRT